MNINYEIFDRKGFKKRPVINFEDKKYIGLEDLLNVDNSLITIDDILEKIKIVEEEKSDFEEIGNERSLLEIRKDQSTISDMFEGIIDDNELYPIIHIDTLKLKDIVLKWKDARKKLMNEIHE
ncbi:hypothetical protein [Oceanobacillus sp. CFH 90083]|uniref:hypothetical protein n=1 Tax=Oceanobacillus sp. CFH 90083 TaxID=2592336 RepID=UPI00128E5238|nr:hypothetical protein [Oceanobacillus sp. CFH 90083]